MSTTQRPFDSIDRRLGPADSRFFGGGFRRVGHRLWRFVITDQPGLGAVSAKAAVSYPADWSRKSSGSPPPHLSSIDAVALGVELLDAYLTHLYKLSPQQRGRSELRSCEMRVGRIQEDLDCFDVTAACSSCEPVSDRAARCTSMFACTIGTVRMTCAVDHETNPLQMPPASYEASFEVLGSGNRYYRDGYKQRRHRIEDLLVDRHQQDISATITVATAGGEDGGMVGFGSAGQPCVSTIDSLLVLAQLAQVLAYEIDGLERASSNTLWMRRLMMSTSGQFPLNTPLPGVVKVIRSGLLSMGQARWRTFDLAGHLMGVRIAASVAHQLPDVNEPARALGDATTTH